MENCAAYKKRLLGSHAGFNQNNFSKVILKQYKMSLSIERKCGSGRKKGFADQNKASKIIRRIFLKQTKLSGREKWLKSWILLKYIKIF